MPFGEFINEFAVFQTVLGEEIPWGNTRENSAARYEPSRSHGLLAILETEEKSKREFAGRIFGPVFGPKGFSETPSSKKGES